MKSLCLILPAFNEGPIIYQVLQTIKSAAKHLPLKTDILVINDGSTDNTSNQVKKAHVKLISHRLNRGLGASLGTGLEYARRHHYHYVVTMDSDGQHDPSDLTAILKPLLTQKADVVIGSRMLNQANSMSLLRRSFNLISNLMTKLFFGIWTTDSLSGFRGFNRKAIAKINIKTERMEASNEFFAEIKKHRLKLIEVPITVIYTDYSIQKGQKPSNAFAIAFRLLLRLFR